MPQIAAATDILYMWATHWHVAKSWNSLHCRINLTSPAVFFCITSVKKEVEVSHYCAWAPLRPHPCPCACPYRIIYQVFHLPPTNISISFVIIKVCLGQSLLSSGNEALAQQNSLESAVGWCWDVRASLSLASSPCYTHVLLRVCGLMS